MNTRTTKWWGLGASWVLAWVVGCAPRSSVIGWDDVGGTGGAQPQDNVGATAALAGTGGTGTGGAGGGGPGLIGIPTPAGGTGGVALLSGGTSGMGGATPILGGAGGAVPLCSAQGASVVTSTNLLSVDAIRDWGWIGADPRSFVCYDIQGAVTALGDGSVCGKVTENICKDGECCINWETRVGVGWGCGIVVEFMNTGDSLEGANDARKLPTFSPMRGLRLEVTGDVPPNGYWIGTTQSASFAYDNFEAARVAPGFRVAGPGTYDAFLPGQGKHGECSATCNGANSGCSITAPKPYDLVLYVRGGESAAHGRMCLRSLRTLDGGIACE